MRPFTDDYEGLIARSLLGKTNAEEQKKLENWLDASPRNRERYSQLRQGNGFSESYRLYNRLDEKAAFRAFRQRTGGRVIPFRSLIKYAAILMLPLSIGAGLYLLKPEASSRLEPDMAQRSLGSAGKVQCILTTQAGKTLAVHPMIPENIGEGFNLEARNSAEGLDYTGFSLVRTVQTHEICTKAGTEYLIRLADGTRVHLNACSRLRYPTAFRGETRDVELSGEAFFEVAKRKNQPFQIHVNHLTIKQYGTTFNVNTFKPDVVQVALVEGQIGMIHNNTETRLRSSQLGTFNRKSEQTSVVTTDLSPFVSWNQGQFIFENETLENMMATVARWYDLRVRFSSPLVASCKFTGSLSRTMPLTDLLAILKYTTDVNITVHGQNVLISQRAQ